MSERLNATYRRSQCKSAKGRRSIERAPQAADVDIDHPDVFVCVGSHEPRAMKANGLGVSMKLLYQLYMCRATCAGNVDLVRFCYQPSETTIVRW